MPSISVPKAVMPGSLFSWRQPQESKPLQPVEDRASVRDSIFNNACSADSNSWLVCFLFTVMLVLTLIAKLYGIWMPEADVVDPTVINKLMGWSNGNSMDSIYRQVTETRLLRTKEQFENFINNFRNKK